MFNVIIKKESDMKCALFHLLSERQAFLYELKKLFKLNDFRYHKSLCFKYLFVFRHLISIILMFGSEIAEKFLVDNRM